MILPVRVIAFFISTFKLDVLFLSQDSMWEVRDEHLYLTAETENIKRQTRPVYFNDDRKFLL